MPKCDDLIDGIWTRWKCVVRRKCFQVRRFILSAMFYWTVVSSDVLMWHGVVHWSFKICTNPHYQNEAGGGGNSSLSRTQKISQGCPNNFRFPCQTNILTPPLDGNWGEVLFDRSCHPSCEGSLPDITYIRKFSVYTPPSGEFRRWVGCLGVCAWPIFPGAFFHSGHNPSDASENLNAKKNVPILWYFLRANWPHTCSTTILFPRYPKYFATIQMCNVFFQPISVVIVVVLVFLSRIHFC